MHERSNTPGRRLATAVLALAGAATLAACGSPQGAMGMGPTASARLEARSGSSAGGSVQFMQMADAVHVMGEVRGLKPNAEHGFHVHERGDCSSADAASAGGHFNPDNAAHGRTGQGAHHAGDMPNLRTDANGVAKVDLMIPGLTVAPGPRTVAGKAVVVHRDPDDYNSQPAGNSGARIACGLIQADAARGRPSGGY